MKANRIYLHRLKNNDFVDRFKEEFDCSSRLDGKHIGIPLFGKRISYNDIQIGADSDYSEEIYTFNNDANTRNFNTLNRAVNLHEFQEIYGTINNDFIVNDDKNKLVKIINIYLEDGDPYNGIETEGRYKEVWVTKEELNEIQSKYHK